MELLELRLLDFKLNLLCETGVMWSFDQSSSEWRVASLLDLKVSSPGLILLKSLPLDRSVTSLPSSFPDDQVVTDQ